MEIRESNYLVQTTDTHVYWYFVADPFSQPRFLGQMTKSEWDAICAVPPTVITGPKRGGNLVFTATLTGADLSIATADEPPILTYALSIPAADWAVMLATLRCD